MGRDGPSHKKERVRLLVFFVYLFYGFLVCVCVCVFMSKKMFFCVLHTTNTLTYFEHFFFYKTKKKQIFKVLKENVF
jgi:hypothetical protein